MHEEYDDYPEQKSKTRRKQEMHALQDIGVELVALSNQKLAELDLPETLLEAVREAKRLTRHEAIRRQMQYIGKLMREVDPEPIRKKLEYWSGQSKENTATLHLIERWRDRLCDDETAFSEFARNYPSADLSHLRSLVRSILKDRQNNKPPKHFRTLFRELRELIEGDSTGQDEVNQE